MPVGLDMIFAGIIDACTLLNLLLIAGGVTLGILVGAIPGLNGPMAIALAVPATFYLEPIGAIGVLVGIMKGSTVGGAVPAILMNTPGTPDAMITTLDGYPMAQKGQSGKALKMAHLSSVTGDTFSDIVLFVAAAPLSVLAMIMGPVEQAGIVFFSICILAALVGDNPLRGLVAASLGFVLSSIGQAPEEATPRLAFGFAELEDGLPLVSVGMGVLVLGEIIHSISERRSSTRGSVAPPSEGDDASLSLAEYLSVKGTMFRSAVIGTLIGSVPGIGSALAATLGYSAARRASKTPEKFGKGTLEGVAATEAANSAVSGANLIPLLTLGIPGNVAAAFLLGALIIHGIIPGPTLMRDEGQLVFSIFTCMAIANFCNLIIGRLGMNLLGTIAKVSAIYIFPLCYPTLYSRSLGQWRRTHRIGSTRIFWGVWLPLENTEFSGGNLYHCLCLGPYLGTSLDPSLNPDPRRSPAVVELPSSSGIHISRLWPRDFRRNKIHARATAGNKPIGGT